MPTKTSKVSRQGTDDVLAQVVGLFGDPANQEVSLGGTLPAVAYADISWGGNFGYTDPYRRVILWSRVLLVDLLSPYDVSSQHKRRALILKPRAMWLFEYAGVGNNVADFIGTSDMANLMGNSTNHHLIPAVKAPYRKGDFITLGMLPAPVLLEDFSGYYTASFGETFDGTLARPSVLSDDAAIAGLTVLGGASGNVTQTEILYYDKNVDARTRYGGSGKSTEETVDVSLCIGGVQRTYRITGQRIA